MFKCRVSIILDVCILQPTFQPKVFTVVDLYCKFGPHSDPCFNNSQKRRFRILFMDNYAIRYLHLPIFIKTKQIILKRMSLSHFCRAPDVNNTNDRLRLFHCSSLWEKEPYTEVLCSKEHLRLSVLKKQI